MTTLTPEVDQAFAALIAAADERAAALVESKCDWTSNQDEVQAIYTHEEWHGHFSCPYQAMAAVLRGQPDPRANHRLDHLDWWGNDSEWIVARGHLDLEQFAADADALARRDGSLEDAEVPSARKHVPFHTWVLVDSPEAGQFAFAEPGELGAVAYTMIQVH